MDTETLINFDEYFESPKASSETIFDEILSKKISLESILIKMEVYLTSKDNQKRSKAVKFISDFIKRASPGYLNPAEIDHLGVYLSSKLDDHYTVSTAALPGLNSLLQLADITTKRALDIIRTSVREIHVQSMMQADRNLVFSMCRFGLSRPDIVAEMHEQKYDTDFVFGFIQAMDGEKDPRNLLVSFECVRLIGEQLDLGPFCDEMFEVFACYFPIDFTPPKEDNLSITKQDLIVSLRRCFASNAKFAKSTVQLLLDKLNSNVDDAHLDSLEVYTECSKTYDPNDYKEYIEPIWALFHRLAMNTTKSSIEEAALTAIHAMAASLSRCLQTGGPVSIEWFVAKSVDSCLGYLNEPDLKLVWPNVRCLQSVASASSTANLLVLKKVLPAVIEHYQTSSQQSQKKTYLEILWQFVSSSLQFDKKPSGVLKDNLAKLLEICIESEPTKNLRQQSLIGFHTLLSFENLITDYEPIVKCLWHSIWVNSSGSEEEKKKVVEIFHVLSKKDEKLNEELLKSLSESTAAESSNYQNSYKIIEHLAQLNQNEQSQATFNKRIIEIFQSHILNAEANFKVDYLISLFESLNSVITKSNDLSDNMELFGRLIEKLIDSCLLGDRNSSFSNSRVIIKLSLLVKSFSLKLKKSEFSLGFLQRVENLFTNEDYLKQFDIDEQKLKLNILMQVVSSLDKLEFVSEVEQIFGKVEKYLKRFAIEDENEDVNLLGCRFLASFVNKLPNVDEYVENLRKSLEIEIEQNKSLKCLNLWIWITKALVLREHKLFEGFTTKIIDWLDDVKLSKMSSSAFGAILNDNPNENLVMTSKTSSNIKLFHKQRFFNFVIEPLKLNFASQEQNKKEQRMFYATSVLSMISPLPKEVLQRHLKSMLPLLLYSLSDTNELDESVCLSSLRSFDLVVRETSSDQEFLFTYTSEILSKLFAMCSYERSMEIRLLALTCVNNLATSLPPDRLIKHQKWVCRELDQSLNDHKRLCRQMAVQARNRWFLLSTKNNEH